MATFNKEWIIRYVEDELSPEEREQFETRLQNDPDLGAEVALYRELKTALRQRLTPDQGEEALRQTLQRLNTEYFSGAEQTGGLKEAGARRIPLTRWLAGMAAAASVIVATVLLWPSDHRSVMDRLGSTEMVSTTERGNNADSLLQQAATHFNKQDFAGALPFLDRAIQADSSNQLALFYEGVAEWHVGRVGDARHHLQEVYNGESLLRYEAAFYMALSYARENDNTAAREWLKKIPSDAPVSGKAKQLETNLK